MLLACLDAFSGNGYVAVRAGCFNGRGERGDERTQLQYSVAVGRIDVKVGSALILDDRTRILAHRS